MSDALNHPITEDDIANYLLHTPDFFVRHAELLVQVQFTSPYSKRTVSLQERQAEMLREKIKSLEKRIMEMIRNASDNAMLADKILSWACNLMMVEDAHALPSAIVEGLQTQFSVPQVALRLWDVAEPYVGLPVAAPVSNDARVFANSLTEPFCGLNTGFEAASWVADPASVTSLALLPLRRLDLGGTPQPAFGLLVLTSPDAQRFSSALGTDFLIRFGEFTSAALTRLQ